MLGLGPRSGAPERALRPRQDAEKRRCHSGSSARFGGGTKKRKGLAAPRTEWGWYSRHPARSRAGRPGLGAEVNRQFSEGGSEGSAAPERRGCRAGDASRHGAVPGASQCSAVRRASPYFGISSSRAGQPLLTDSRGDLPLPLLAGCISARHAVGGRGRDEATGHGE